MSSLLQSPGRSSRRGNTGLSHEDGKFHAIAPTLELALIAYLRRMAARMQEAMTKTVARHVTKEMAAKNNPRG